MVASNKMLGCWLMILWAQSLPVTVTDKVMESWSMERQRRNAEPLPQASATGYAPILDSLISKGKDQAVWRPSPPLAPAAPEPLRRRAATCTSCSARLAHQRAPPAPGASQTAESLAQPTWRKPTSTSAPARLYSSSAGSRLTRQHGTPRIASGNATRSVRRQQGCKAVRCTACAPPTSGTRTSTGLSPRSSSQATPSPASLRTWGRNETCCSPKARTECIFPTPPPPGCTSCAGRPVEFTNHQRE
mmetsp:Transcript_45130/g.144553  ORF Transcript_45130/g.144553 Transcript_45130/m.144553 type:complete len:246 (+) Transcript_45130:509-1246(+)